MISGIPYDNAVTYRPGTRLGPRAIRAGSVQLTELKHFPSGIEPFEELSVIDYGDCMINPHDPTSVFDTIEAHADHILASGARMLSLGGDHSIAYPLLKAHAKKYGPVVLIQFDAHCDTWEDDGVRFDHGTMFARAANEGIIDVSKSTQVGLRTYNDSDYGFEILSSPWCIAMESGQRSNLPSTEQVMHQSICPLTLMVLTQPLPRVQERRFLVDSPVGRDLNLFAVLNHSTWLEWILSRFRLPMTMPKSRPSQPPALPMTGLPFWQNSGGRRQSSSDGYDQIRFLADHAVCNRPCQRASAGVRSGPPGNGMWLRLLMTSKPV